MPDTNAQDSPAPPTPPPRRRARLLIPLILTFALATIPAVVELSLAYTAAVIAAVLCGLLWFGVGAIRLEAFLRRRDLARYSASHHSIDEPEIIRAILAQRDVICPRCRYNLRGLSAATCPECQEPIRLHLSGPRSHMALVWLTRLVLLGVRHPAVSGGVTIGYWISMRTFYSRAFGASMLLRFGSLCIGPALAVLGSAWLLIVVVRWLRCRDLQLREATRWRVLCSGAALLALLSLCDLVMWVVQLVTW